METGDTGGWKPLRRSDHRQGYILGASMQIGNEIQGRVPSALVHPFPSSEAYVVERETSSHIMHNLQHGSTHSTTPYLLPSVQTASPAIPLRTLERSPPSITLNVDHVVHCSPNARDMDLQSLRYQVKEIQSKLSGDVTGSSEYQELLSEKLNLEAALGSTEYALQQLKMSYNDFKKSTSTSEKELLHKLNDIQDRHQILGERHKSASDQLTRLKEYLRDLPTHEEHQQLQQEIAKKSAQISHLSSKVDHLSQEVKKLSKREREQEVRVEALTQERDDFSLKLNLTENLLKTLETQRAEASEGQYSKEDLLWTLDQLKKELENARKLLSYRKQKLESFQKEILAQNKEHTKKLQAEVEVGEKLKETVQHLEREVEQYKLQEEMMKNKLASVEGKQKKTEQRLERMMEQVVSQSKMSSLIRSLVKNLHIAVNQLKDMVTICRQISQGSSPDMSLLLSFSDFLDDDEVETLSNANLTARLKEVESLIKELEDVREYLQEQYAHHLAKNITCVPM